MKRIMYILAAVVAVLVSTPAWAAPLAWPIEPPDKAFISGPGLDGEVEITDPGALEALKLGGLEDFEQGRLPEPEVAGEGYTITRYFYGGEFNFGMLHYYPGTEEQAGYVYFVDGPDLEGDHTAYNEGWFHVTPAGEAAMKSLLQSLGVMKPGAAPSSFSWSYVLIGTAVVAAISILLLAARRS